MQGGAAAQDEDEANELLESMAPTQPWATPPPNAPVAPDADPIAAGEDSTESSAEAQRIQTVRPYPPLHKQLMEHELSQDPFLPFHAEQEPPLDYTLAVIMLHTPKELADQAAAQQQQQQQQQQHLHQQPPPGHFQQPQGMPTYATALQPPGMLQQPGVGLQPPAQPLRTPGGLGPRPPLQHAVSPQHMHGQAGGPGPGVPAFRPPPGGGPPPSAPHPHQPPNVMRPMQVCLALSQHMDITQIRTMHSASVSKSALVLLPVVIKACVGNIWHHHGAVYFFKSSWEASVWL